jgi:branched-chain amino acid transport system permease protein
MSVTAVAHAQSPERSGRLTGGFGLRHAPLLGVGLLAVVVPLGLSDFNRFLVTQAVVAGLLALSLVFLTGLVGQTSFCQYSFAAIGAFTVGALVAGHHWNFWLAFPTGVLFAAAVGLVVGIPALRLSGLFLAVLTVAVALFFDRYVLAAGTWNGFSGGVTPWLLPRPTLFGVRLSGAYAFYLFALALFLVATWLVVGVWRSRSGRVLRAIRDAEIAASTLGIDVTRWKLAAFAVAAGLAGIAGGLQAVLIGSVSAGSFDLQHSIQLAAIATVVGVGSVASPAVAGLLLVFGPELLRHTPLSARWFPLVVGGLLVGQLVATPEGLVVALQTRWRRR